MEILANDGEEKEKEVFQNDTSVPGVEGGV